MVISASVLRSMEMITPYQVWKTLFPLGWIQWIGWKWRTNIDNIQSLKLLQIKTYSWSKSNTIRSRYSKWIKSTREGYSYHVVVKRVYNGFFLYILLMTESLQDRGREKSTSLHNLKRITEIEWSWKFFTTSKEMIEISSWYSHSSDKGMVMYYTDCPWWDQSEIPVMELKSVS